MVSKGNGKIAIYTKVCTLTALVCILGSKTFSSYAKCTGITRRLSNKCGVTKNGGVCCDGTKPNSIIKGIDELEKCYQIWVCQMSA